MPKLIPIGHYRELVRPPCEPPADWLSMRDDVRDVPQDNEDKIVAYLRDGVGVSGLGCYLSDVLDPTDRRALNGGTLTDGVYSWAEYMPHYVAKYHLRLPEDFIRHMASRDWRPPSEEEVDINAAYYGRATGTA